MLKRILFAGFLLSGIIISSCNPVEKTETKVLSSPELEIVKQTENSFRVEWKEVPGAVFYTVAFQSEDGEISQDTYVEYTELEEGVYTVTVTANAPLDSKEYKDSEPAVIEVTVAKATWFTQELYPYEYFDAGFFPYSSLAVTFKASTNIRSIYYNLFESSEIESLDDEQIKEMLFNLDVSYIKQLNAAGEFSFIADNTLEPATEYELVSVITNGEGDAILRRTKAFTEAIPAPHANLANWIGTWTATCAKSWIIAEEEDGLTISLTDTEQAFDITIEIDPTNANSVYVIGLSAVYPDVAARGIYIPETNTLDIYSGIAIGYNTEWGLDEVWSAQIGYNGYFTADPVTYAPIYSLTLNSDNSKATSILLPVKDSEGNSYTTYGMEIYARSPYGEAVPCTAEYPLTYRAGNMTWVKKQ